jgi:hypothetical protein
MSSLTVEELEGRMRPGVLSQHGFLGDDESLQDLLDEDARVVEELGVTYDAIADRLEALIEAAESSPDHTFQTPLFGTTVEVFTGFQICPWAPDVHHGQCTAGRGVRFGNLQWRIRNRRLDLDAAGPGLIVHLIREHHFFEGVDSRYRVDPRQIVELLELEPPGEGESTRT